jgi:hypothetical protein
MTAKYAINHIWELFEDELGERFTKYLKKHGYDSAKFTEYADNNGEEIKSNTIVVLNKNLIKKIKNTV